MDHPIKNIRYHKWTKEGVKKLYQSFRHILNIEEPQLYFPIMSLFFYIHNTKFSHKIIDFQRNQYIQEIVEYKQLKDYNSNISVEAKVFNRLQENKKISLFGKVIPLLDPIHYLLNNYNNSNHRNPLLPSNYSFNTFTKINDMNNMAYIDVFFSYLVSRIVESDKNPSFPLYYGSMNCVGEYSHDITEDIDELKYHGGFQKMVDLVEIDEYVNGDSDSCSDSCSDSSSNSSSSSLPDNDYVARFKKFPIIYLFIESLEGTLEDIIKNDLSLNLLKSCLFQISFALIYLQKHFHFTHNDLHINNVMFSSTNKPYLYYKYNNHYYKVPTYGKMFKIIDFGRSIFTYGMKTYMNDVFSKYGEAEGQYTHPPQVNFLKTNYDDMVYPSYHFDLCRLAITMIDEIRYNHDDDLEDEDDYQDFLDFLKYLVTDKNGVRLDKEKDNFDLYVKISRNACNCLPRDVICESFFKEYRIKKKQFPKSTYYTV